MQFALAAWNVVFYSILPWAGGVCLIALVHGFVSARRSRAALARLTEVVPPAPIPSLEPDVRVGATEPAAPPQWML